MYAVYHGCSWQILLHGDEHEVSPILCLDSDASFDVYHRLQIASRGAYASALRKTKRLLINNQSIHDRHHTLASYHRDDHRSRLGPMAARNRIWQPDPVDARTHPLQRPCLWGPDLCWEPSPVRTLGFEFWRIWRKALFSYRLITSVAISCPTLEDWVILRHLKKMNQSGWRPVWMLETRLVVSLLA